VGIFYHTLLTVGACSSAQGQGFSNVFFLFPSPPQKRGKERDAGWALPRPTGITLFLTLGWGGLLPIRATFAKSCLDFLLHGFYY